MLSILYKQQEKHVFFFDKFKGLGIDKYIYRWIYEKSKIERSNISTYILYKIQ